MCGIIGYVGDKHAVPILIEGLKKLEYRGYDSSGIGVISKVKKNVILRKMKGKICNLEKLIETRAVAESHIGISHTRWATHGEPNRINSHPHTDCSKNFVVVHNGIIENYDVLKTALQARGHHFSSDTDTEVIVHLIEENYKGDFFKAVQKTLKKLQGAFALGVLSKADPDVLITARIGSPLIIGVGEGENFIASDVPAILDRTKKIIYLKDGEMARITSQSIDVTDFAGKKVKAKEVKILFDLDTAQKQGYAHFMLKEMHEQPYVMAKLIKVHLKGKNICFDGATFSDKYIKGINRVFIVACGTAYHAGLVGKYLIEKFAGVPVSIDVSSEFRYRDPILDKQTMLIAISQSGETADTLAAVREAKKRGVKIVSICNVVGSSLVRESDEVLYTHAGPEIGVASTKAYTAQVATLYLFALRLSQVLGRLRESEIKKLVASFRKLPDLYEDILKQKKLIARVAKKNSHFGCFLFLGRNINYPSAMEGALKLKEISYIPAEGYAAGEMKHGPIALIDEYRAVVCVAPQSATYDKMVSNMQEIKARRGKIIVIASEGDEAIKKHAHHVIRIPQANEFLTPLLVALPLQLLAYYISVQLGCDVDQPRNLAKSVTVE